MLASFCRVLALISLLFLTACGTTDSAMQQQGRSESYITGFHDGRHSGMKEAGNNYEHYIKDIKRFESDAGYREGWVAGEAEGKELQAQAVAVGNAAAGAAGAYSVGKEIDKARPHPHDAAKAATKNVDTEVLKSLEQ